MAAMYQILKELLYQNFVDCYSHLYYANQIYIYIYHTANQAQNVVISNK